MNKNLKAVPTPEVAILPQNAVQENLPITPLNDFEQFKTDFEQFKTEVNKKFQNVNSELEQVKKLLKNGGKCGPKLNELPKEDLKKELKFGVDIHREDFAAACYIACQKKTGSVDIRRYSTEVLKTYSDYIACRICANYERQVETVSSEIYKIILSDAGLDPNTAFPKRKPRKSKLVNKVAP